MINAASNWAPLVINIAIGFLLTPYLISNLGDQNYGIWVVVASFLGYYGLLRMGVGSAIMRYVPFYASRNDQTAISQIVSTAMASFIAVGLIVLAISFLAADTLASFLNGGPTLAALIRVMGIAAAIECPLRILDATIRSQEKWVQANGLTVMTAVLRAVGLATCAALGYGVVEMGMVMVIVNIIALLITLILFKRFCPTITMSPAMIKPARLKTLVTFGLFVTISTTVCTLRLPSQNIIIGKLMSLQVITLYYPAVLIMKNIRQAVLAPVRVFWPRFAYLDGGNNHDQVTALFLKGARFCSLFAAGMILLVFISGPAFIRLWLGSRFTTVVPALMLLAAGFLIETSFSITASLLGGIGRQRAHAAISSIEGVLGILLSIMLGAKMGLPGIAAGFLISVFIMQGIFCSWYVCRILKIKLMKYYSCIILRPSLLLMLFAAAAHGLQLDKAVHSWPSLIILTLTFACLYTVSAYLVGLDYQSKEKVNTYIKASVNYLKKIAGFSVLTQDNEAYDD